MRALQLLGWKQRPQLVDVDEPDPGPGQVVIEIGGSGACHSDLHLMDDFEGGVVPWDPPFTLGHENAGWVHALGPGVTGLTIGQPVVVYGPWGCGSCRRCRLGQENYCERQASIGAAGGGLGLDGGMAPLLLVPSPRHLVPLDGLHPADAAPLADAGLTPYHAVKRSLDVLVPGSTAVVIGAGGLGQMAVRYLRAMSPAIVVAVDRSDRARTAARAAGADVTVGSGPDAASAVLDASRGAGVELVLDFVGTDETLALAQRVARPLAHVTLVGIAGGATSFSFFSQAYEVSLATTYWGSLPELVEVVALAEAGTVVPTIQRYDLEQATDAYDAMRRGDLDGRAVIVPTSA